MILRTMLNRLYASLTSGPALNARPHRSRQRMDLMGLEDLGSPSHAILNELLGGRRSVELAATVPAFIRTDVAEGAWTAEQRAHKERWERQVRVLDKLRDIAEDANDYYNDHGEQALFIGFPLVSVPVRADRNPGTGRILAPALLMPVSLRVRRGTGAGVTIEAIGEGADLLLPNPGLLAWIEQQTGRTTEDLVGEGEEEPWAEVARVLERVQLAAGIATPFTFQADTPLQPTPRTESLPPSAAMLPCAVLGLFPLANPGLLRDTRWMMDNEPALEGPVKAFLHPDALAEPAELPAPAEDGPPSTGPRRDPAADLLVTHADPCQAGAVQHARDSRALVVHGPPGTGKSQTIANIIGDHLARGQRVLFVCDKRTALDVVKYRLDAMGLGALCAVVHDPQRDRRDLYLALRERLDDLPDERPVPDPSPRLSLVNERLAGLYAELRSYFDSLHGMDADGATFHAHCGEWLELQRAGVKELEPVDGVTPELIERHRTDIDEVTRRAVKARWPGSPFRDALALTLAGLHHVSPGERAAALDRLCAAAARSDALRTPDALPLDGTASLHAVAEARAALLVLLRKVLSTGPVELTGALLERDRAALRTSLKEAEPGAALLERPLDRELSLQAGGTRPTLAEVNRHLLALKEWDAIATSWRRFLALRVRREARAVMAGMGLRLSTAEVRRALDHLEGLRIRHLWSDLHTWAGGRQPDEAALLRLARGGMFLLDLLERLELPENEPLRAMVLDALRLPREAPAAVERLQASVEQARALAEVCDGVRATGLFKEVVLHEREQAWRQGVASEPWVTAVRDHLPDLEESLRLEDRLVQVPAPLERMLRVVAAKGMDHATAMPALRAAALWLLITRRSQDDPVLSRIDGDRIGSAFAELLARSREKTGLVRELIAHTWQGRQRARLMAGTGTRLNGLGASLRQRLFVRGRKAMKLRQMIASGAGGEDGDPLFDLCPVWMASPSTVAQIFGRDPLFDVVVFDEASQCRLEEALPVLLRGARVVIAGDPKQLPPTRFFEATLADSDDSDAEDLEEVFIARQTQAEDLLSAALNLNVQQAFLDVHYRSRHDGLIGFSNEAFYGGRLQPIPGHPRNKLMRTPIALVRVDGVYLDRTNPSEAEAAVDLVDRLLQQPEPPSIGVACFNLTQRDAILDELDRRAAADAGFAQRLATARQRQGRDSFEGLFVKNLENVQGDERDHMIISTTFGPAVDGRFRRNFGALSRLGGERRLNVLVTRAREQVHVLTSIPREEYMARATEGAVTGRHHLYAYLRYAEELAQEFGAWQQVVESLHAERAAESRVNAVRSPSPVAEALGRWLSGAHGIANQVHYGNEGFCVDVALTHPGHPADVTVGVLTDFNRYLRSPDPVAWELFRSHVLEEQGWELRRIWSPSLFRDHLARIEEIRSRHQAIALESRVN